jgi:hypothetical protein
LCRSGTDLSFKKQDFPTEKCADGQSIDEQVLHGSCRIFSYSYLKTRAKYILMLRIFDTIPSSTTWLLGQRHVEVIAAKCKYDMKVL